MSSGTGSSPKNSSWLFWVVILVIAISFFMIKESRDNRNIVKSGSETSPDAPSENSQPATNISEAPKLISDSKEALGALTIPFSKLYHTAPVNDLLFDPKGRIWVAHEAGVSSIQDDMITHYSINEGSFPFAHAECLAYDGKNLWVGTLAGLCQQNESGRFVRSELSDSLPSQVIWSMQWDGTTIWAGTQKGAAFMKPGDSFQTIDEANTNSGLRDNWCHKIIRFSSWFVAAHDRGLSIWNINFPASNPELWKNIDHAKSVISRPITDMAFDGRNLWLGTARGVLMLSTPIDHFFNDFVPNLVSFSRIHGLPANRVNAIIAHRGAIWIGTDEGLARIKDERIQLINASSGNFSQRVRKLAASGDILWIGTDKGVQFINTAMVD